MPPFGLGHEPALGLDSAIWAAEAPQLHLWQEHHGDRRREAWDAQVSTDVHADSLDGPQKANPALLYSALHQTGN